RFSTFQRVATADAVERATVSHRTGVPVEKLVDEVVDNPSSERLDIVLPLVPRPAADDPGGRTGSRGPGTRHSGMFSAWAETGPLRPRSPVPAREADIDGFPQRSCAP